MKVETKLKTYVENAGEKRIDITVKSHGSFHDRVIIEIDGKEYIIIAQQLQKAITNAINVV